MKADQWRHIDRIFQEALDRAPAERMAFIEEVCAGDVSLLKEVHALILSHEHSGSFLESPAAKEIRPSNSTIESGTRFGPYEVRSILGAGGMGEVYRAHDTTLKRDVALKVLPELYALDADRMERFKREAQLLASMNHPNIAHVYGLEQSGARRCIVMELIEGDLLQERIQKGPIPVDKALTIAKQIAEALEAAHEKGIIHRDLKPANIKLTPDGKVKVLDFGLAKAYEAVTGSPDLSISPPMSNASTQAGMILGTAAYMSPEQVVGKRVDKRADIWAFGVVLWEMLTGEQLFKGEMVPDIAASVLKEQPDLTRVPFKVRRLLAQCLDKNPQTRLRDIGDAMLMLEEPPPAPRRRSKIAWIAAALVTAVAVAGLWGWLKPGAAAEPRVVTHFIAATPQGLIPSSIMLSPDGSRIAYSSGHQIFVREMNRLEAKPLAGTENGLFAAFSPDGRWIAFSVPAPDSTWKIERVHIAGGAPQTIANIFSGGTMSWEADGTILLGGPTLRRMPEGGGEPATIAKVDPTKGEKNFISPKLLPGGKYILSSIVPTTGILDLRAVAIDVMTGEKTTLLEGVGETLFAPTGANPETGHLFWSRGGSMFAAPFNTRTLHVGPSVPVLEGLSGIGAQTVAGVSRNGTLAYIGNASAVPNKTLVWVDRQGTEKPLLTPGRRIFGNPQISPNGRSVALSIVDFAKADGTQLWVYDLSRGITTPLTFESFNAAPVWTPDSARLIYASSKTMGAKGTIASVAVNGSGQPLRIIPEETTPSTPISISFDGKSLIGIRSGILGLTGNEAWVLALEGTGASQAGPQPFLDNRFNRGYFQFSPDGKWVAYDSNETGRSEIFVVPFPGPGGRSQVSIDGGTNPRWNRNGPELFFRNGVKMMVAGFESGAEFRPLTPTVLFEKQSAGYDVASDGRRFLMLKAVPGDQEMWSLHVIVSWFDELRNLAPLGK